jgi:hypothetical protein
LQDSVFYAKQHAKTKLDGKKQDKLAQQYSCCKNLFVSHERRSFLFSISPVDAIPLFLIVTVNAITATSAVRLPISMPCEQMIAFIPI